MFKKLLKDIKEYEQIIIHRHSRPDGDALGSQFGLAQILKDNFPDKNILCVGNKDEYKNSSLKNIFKDEFDNVSDEEYKNSLVIVLDTANVERIEGQDFFKGKLVYKIDHHASAEEFGNVEIVLDTISSTSQIISEFAFGHKLNITKKSAVFLLTGMITDTGRFMFNSVNAETFTQVANLLKSGAKIHSIVQKLNDRNINFIRLQGKILSDLTYKNGVSSYMMPKGLHKKYDVPYSTASSLIFLLMSFSEAKYAIYSTYDSKNKNWKTSLRSRAKNINGIAEEYDGGGHKMAAGLKIKDKKEFDEVLKKLHNLNKNNE